MEMEMMRFTEGKLTMFSLSRSFAYVGQMVTLVVVFMSASLVNLQQAESAPYYVNPCWSASQGLPSKGVVEDKDLPGAIGFQAVVDTADAGFFTAYNQCSRINGARLYVEPIKKATSKRKQYWRWDAPGTSEIRAIQVQTTGDLNTKSTDRWVSGIWLGGGRIKDSTKQGNGHRVIPSTASSSPNLTLPGGEYASNFIVQTYCSSSCPTSNLSREYRDFVVKLEDTMDPRIELERAVVGPDSSVKQGGTIYANRDWGFNLSVAADDPDSGVQAIWLEKEREGEGGSSDELAKESFACPTALFPGGNSTTYRAGLKRIPCEINESLEFKSGPESSKPPSIGGALGYIPGGSGKTNRFNISGCAMDFSGRKACQHMLKVVLSDQQPGLAPEGSRVTIDTRGSRKVRRPTKKKVLIQGRVIDADGKGLDGIQPRVVLERRDGVGGLVSRTELSGVQTDASGRWRLRVEPSIMTVSASLISGSSTKIRFRYRSKVKLRANRSTMSRCRPVIRLRGAASFADAGSPRMEFVKKEKLGKRWSRKWRPVAGSFRVTPFLARNGVIRKTITVGKAFAKRPGHRIKLALVPARNGYPFVVSRSNAITLRQVPCRR